MPYKSIDQLPKATANLPDEAREIYMGAFNGAYKTYEKHPDREEISHRTAWKTVKLKYAKDAEGVWKARKPLRESCVFLRDV